MINIDIPKAEAEAIRAMLAAKRDIVAFHCDRCEALRLDKVNYQVLIDRFDSELKGK